MQNKGHYATIGTGPLFRVFVDIRQAMYPLAQVISLLDLNVVAQAGFEPTFLGHEPSVEPNSTTAQ